MKPKVQSHEIVRALAKRHKKDMFFTEVKDGSTQLRARHSKIDALAIPLSWAHYNIQGYEVKVSRGDFLQDQKWMAYLPMCNQLYWAVADGVCGVEEIPEQCGLLVFNGKGLRMKKKAPYREIEPPVEMYKYLLFSYIGAYELFDRGMPRYARLLPGENAEMARAYLDGKKNLRDLGYHFKSRLIEQLRETERERKALDEAKRTQKCLDAVRYELGLSSWSRTEDYEKKLRELKAAGVSPSVKRRLDQLGHLIYEIQAETEAPNEKPGEHHHQRRADEL